MKENKNTKKALFGSILSMIVCVGLLVGSTFAWFTDSVTSKGNIIKSGNLDVTMEWADGREAVESAEWKDASTGPIFNNEKWEPGYAEAKHIKIENKGNLAFKYEVRIAVDGEVSELANVIDVYYVQDGKQLTDRNDLGTKVGTLREVLDNPVVAKGHVSKGEADIATIALKMQETAGNEYMGKSIGENFTIQLVATQYTEEEDSFGSDYDANANYENAMYPDGVTSESFGDNIAYFNGQYYETFTDALNTLNTNGGGELYFKKGSVVNFNTHIAVTSDLTIYANGADFMGRDISIGTSAEPTENETTINIHDAKNLTVWGEPSNRGNVWNVNMYHVVNDGCGLLMYRGENNKDKINFFANNCSVANVMDALHTTASGTVTVKNCTFNAIDAGINIAYKCNDEMNVTVENSTFTKCGKINEADDYFAPVRFVNNWFGDLNVTLKNNVFTDTIGTNGDVLLGDYRSGKLSFGVTCVIETKEDIMLKNSKEPAHSVGSGSYGIEK